MSATFARLAAVIGVLLLGGVLAVLAFSRPVETVRSGSTGPNASAEPPAVEASPAATERALRWGAPVARETATPYPCQAITVIADGPEPSVENNAVHAASVFVGRVIEVGEARWNTPDGERPASAPLPDTPIIYRPVTVEIVAAIRGPENGERVVLDLLGGEVGCDSVSYAGLPVLTMGGTYAVFHAPPAGVPSTARTTAMWPVDGDVVVTPVDGELTIAQLRRMVEAVPFRPFPTPRSGG